MKNLIVIAIFSTLMLLSSCNNAVEYTADQLTIAGLSAQPGYAWFSQEVAAYTPDAANVALIKASYASMPFSTYIYVNPSCTCTGTQKHFPRLASTLKAAGIPDSSIVVLSMRNAATKQPYADKYPVKVIPTFYFVNGSSYLRKLEPPQDSTSRVDSLLVKTLQ